MNVFKSIEGVKELFSDDGYYRYTTGEYSSYSDAKNALAQIQKAGYSKAFIKVLNQLNDK
jgi:hypothetical protein